MDPELPPPPLRGSSKSKDTVESTTEMAVRIRPPRSISPKDLLVSPVRCAQLRHLVENYHYLHSMPAGTVASFGVFSGLNLVGAAVFSIGARYASCLVKAARPADVATLARLWLSDDLPKNSESRVLGIVLRHLKHQRRWKFLLSYADPAAGHSGGIYQATGWLYLGLSESTGYLDLGDGKLHHPRTVSNRYGSQARDHLRAKGVKAKRVNVPGKHRYIHFLDPSWSWRLRIKPQPYPKLPDNQGA